MEKKRKINTSSLILLLITPKKTHLFFSVFFIFFIFLFSTTCLDTTRRCSPVFAKADDDRGFQKSEEGIGESTMHGGGTRVGSWIWARRNLGGPGSSPPRCTSKCGRCTPCRPVHVPVPPGTPVTAEYYPEAWRCKCGNKLYMP